jgi:urea transport system permease protein
VTARLNADERSPWNARFWTGFALSGLVLGLLVPLLNRWVAPDSPFAVPDYLVPLLGKYLCYAILALSLDLVWGSPGS